MSCELSVLSFFLPIMSHFPRAVGAYLTLKT